jgi:hypothetical protein
MIKWLLAKVLKKKRCVLRWIMLIINLKQKP